MIQSLFEKGSVVTDAGKFTKETVSANQVEVSNGAEDINLTATKHRLLLSNKTSVGSCIYLPYAPGAVNWVLPQGKAVLSSQFTGCWFVKYKLDGQIRVAHVGTPQCNDLWAEMQQRRGFELICAFKPTDMLDTAQQFKMLQGKAGSALTIALITNDDKCYSGLGTYWTDTKAACSRYQSLMWKKVG